MVAYRWKGEGGAYVALQSEGVELFFEPHPTLGFLVHELMHAPQLLCQLVDSVYWGEVLFIEAFYFCVELLH